MKYWEVMEQAKNNPGLKAKRPHWTGHIQWWFNKIYAFRYFNYGAPENYIYKPTVEDIDANDWIFVE